MDRLYARLLGTDMEPPEAQDTDERDVDDQEETKADDQAWGESVEQAAHDPLPDTPLRSARLSPGSARRNVGLRLSWASPFGIQGMSPPRLAGTEENDEGVGDDVTMASVSGRSVASGPSLLPNKTQDRLMVAPTMKQAPTLRDETVEAVRIFGDEYTAYMNYLSSYETTHSRPYIMPPSACIPVRLRWRIAHYYLKKEYSKCTDDDFTKWILDVLAETDGQGYRLVDEAMKKLKMNTRVRNPRSRVSKLLRDMHEILHQTRQEVQMMEKEPKKIVGYLVEALEPPVFKASVVADLKLEVYKHLKSSPVLFTDYLMEAVVPFARWEHAITVDAKPSAKLNQQQGGGGGNKKGKRGTGGAPATSGSTAASGGGAQASGGDGGVTRTRVPCLTCQSLEHLVRECPELVGRDDEKKRLIAQYRAEKRGGPRVASLSHQSHTAPEEPSINNTQLDRGTARATLPVGIELEALLDSGGDVSYVSKTVVEKMQAAGEFVEIATAKEPSQLYPLGHARIRVWRRIRIRGIKLATAPLVLPTVEFYVDDDCGHDLLILGRSLMQQLGYSTDKLLLDAVRKLGGRPVPEASDEEEKPEPGAPTSPLRVSLMRLECSGEDRADEYEEKMALPNPEPASMDDVQRILYERCCEAVVAGLPEEDAATLRELLQQYREVFRLVMGCDPPIAVEPLRVRFKEGAIPVKCGMRRMSPIHAAYVEKHLKELVEAKYLRRNPRSRWASPVRVVPKSTPGELRMVADVRAPNKDVIPIRWPMPHAELVPLYLVSAAAVYFFNLDADKMFWQLACTKIRRSRTQS